MTDHYRRWKFICAVFVPGPTYPGYEGVPIGELHPVWSRPIGKQLWTSATSEPAFLRTLVIIQGRQWSDRSTIATFAFNAYKHEWFLAAEQSCAKPNGDLYLECPTTLPGDIEVIECGT